MARDSSLPCRPLFRCNYDWSNSSGFETAHSRALLKIRAIQFGPSGQQTKFPLAEVAHLLWSDGTSWFERHSDSGEDVWPGTIQLDFRLVAGQFYAIWMYCQLFADFQPPRRCVMILLLGVVTASGCSSEPRIISPFGARTGRQPARAGAGAA
jgi:hypothetical protein